MAHHLTPTELAGQTGMDPRDVIAMCLATGVPIFHGRIDTTLYEAALRERDVPAPSRSVRVHR